MWRPETLINDLQKFHPPRGATKTKGTHKHKEFDESKSRWGATGDRRVSVELLLSTRIAKLCLASQSTSRQQALPRDLQKRALHLSRLLMSSFQTAASPSGEGPASCCRRDGDSERSHLRHSFSTTTLPLTRRACQEEGRQCPRRRSQEWLGGRAAAVNEWGRRGITNCLHHTSSPVRGVFSERGRWSVWRELMKSRERGRAILKQVPWQCLVWSDQSERLRVAVRAGDRESQTWRD